MIQTLLCHCGWSTEDREGPLSSSRSYWDSECNMQQLRNFGKHAFAAGNVSRDLTQGSKFCILSY